MSTLVLKELNSSIKIVKEIPSPALIEWADAVIVGNTSILFEAFCQNKTLIYPSYFYTITMVLEEMHAGWVVDSYEELEKALIRLKEDKAFRPYPQKNVDRFITEMVYGGVKDRDVLNEYKDFILKKSVVGNCAK